MLELVKQNESKNISVKQGRDLYGGKLSNKIIQKSLELETLFKGVEEVELNDGFSDWGTSYTLCVKINNPHSKFKNLIKPKSSEVKELTNSDIEKLGSNIQIVNQFDVDSYDLLMEIFPQKSGKGYSIRDYRLLNSVKKNSSMELVGFNNVKNLSLEDLVERLFNVELSLSMFGMMKVENQTSSVNVDYDITNIMVKSNQSFDFDREELKKQLLNKLKK